MNNCLGVFYFKDSLPWDLWSCKKKYLLAYKSENIAPTPWALGNGGENRNWKCPGHTVPEIPEEGTISGHLSQGQNLV